MANYYPMNEKWGNYCLRYGGIENSRGVKFHARQPSYADFVRILFIQHFQLSFTSTRQDNEISKITLDLPRFSSRPWWNLTEDGSIEIEKQTGDSCIMHRSFFASVPRHATINYIPVNSTESDNGDKRVSVPMIHGTRCPDTRFKNSSAFVVAQLAKFSRPLHRWIH